MTAPARLGLDPEPARRRFEGWQARSFTKKPSLQLSGRAEASASGWVAVKAASERAPLAGGWERRKQAPVWTFAASWPIFPEKQMANFL